MTTELLQFFAYFAAAFAVCTLFYTLHFIVLSEMAKNIGDWYSRTKYVLYAISCALMTLALTVFSSKNIN